MVAKDPVFRFSKYCDNNQHLGDKWATSAIEWIMPIEQAKRRVLLFTAVYLESTVKRWSRLETVGEQSVQPRQTQTTSLFQSVLVHC